VKQPLEGAAAEFQRIALVHLDVTFRFAYRLSRDAAVAQDLTQETFLRAWRGFERFDRLLPARPWLFGILYHVWQHERRRRARIPVLIDSAILRDEALAWDPPVPQGFTDDDVVAALDRLPEAIRDTVLLADVEELSYRSVSEVISVPMGTVMSRLSRGRGLLRQALADYAQRRGIGPERRTAKG
jgi:RNA polymerase sigma-70 factor (ECF subfamily)